MICDRCGVSTPSAESDTGDFDEDSGDFLCGLCLAENESCGCSDSLIIEDDE